jgi:autotransporter-associated beta strand protein
VIVEGPGILNLAGFNQSIGSLAGAGSVLLGTGTLRTGNDNTNTTFSGGIAGAGALIKVGTGTSTLNGLNTYTGSTTVDKGVVVVGDPAHPGAGLFGGARSL